MAEWFIEDVAERFAEAAETSRRLPRVTVQGYFNVWPAFARDAWEVYPDDEHVYRPLPPSPHAIEQMLETMRWVHPRSPWAHATLGRFLASALYVYHITGVAVWLLPEKDCLGGNGTDSWRLRAQEPFKWWLRITQTNQGWKMFAPNPPRNNLMMRVLVTDTDGEAYDLNTDVYHPANRPIPWVFYTRTRKNTRRIIGAEGGKGEWYQKWHARYICRQWVFDHGGQALLQVDLVKLSYAIPTPEKLAQQGPYDPVEVGRVALITNEILQRNTLAFSNFIQKIRVDGNLVLPEFLFYYLKVMHNVKLTESMQSQTKGIRNLIMGSFYNQHVVLPSIDIQRNIVNHVNMMHSQINALKSEAQSILDDAKAQIEKMILA